MNASGNIHLSESQVSEFADGTLDPREEPLVLSHIGRCDSCNREVAETRALLALSRNAHADIAAPPELWPLVAGATVHAARGTRVLAVRLARLLLVVAFAILTVALALSLRARLRDRGSPPPAAASGTDGSVHGPPAPRAPASPAAPRAPAPDGTAPR